MEINNFLKFKDDNNMFVINSNRFLNVPIMSFQTNKNGTFNPSFAVAGTLIWDIGGTIYNTNSPSVALTGATVDVKVYAGTVLQGATLSGQTSFSSMGIIGELDFSWFTLSGMFQCFSNPLLTSLKFSSFTNTCSDFRAYSNNLLSLNLSNVAIQTRCYVFSNANLATLTLNNTVAQTWTDTRLEGTKIVNLNFTNITLNGSANIGNAFLETVVFHAGSCNLTIGSCKIANLDLTNQGITGLNVGSSFLTGITFRNIENVVSNSFTILGVNAAFTSLDLSRIRFSNSVVTVQNLTAITSINFGAYVHTFAQCLVGGNRLTSLDLNGDTVSVRLYCNGNINLATLAMPNITTSFVDFRADNNALDVASVDAVFAKFNTFFSANTALNALTIRLDGGTNAAPTGGSNNVDRLNLISIFAAAGKTLTISQN